jgi:putative transposase
VITVVTAGKGTQAFSPEVRKILYTTHAIESLHSQVRRSIRNKGHFPSDEAASKLLYLALRNIEAKWKRAKVLSPRPFKSAACARPVRAAAQSH